MKTLIFDLYGTLIDILTDEGQYELYDRMSQLYASYGAWYTPEELRETYFRTVREEQEKTGGLWPEPDLRTVFLRLLKEKGGNAENEAQWTEVTARVFRILSRIRLELYPGTEETLRFLKQKGHRMILLSNAQSVFTMPEIRMTGLDRYLDDILISSDWGIKKPDPAFMEILLKKHHLKAAECMMIGNDFSSDIRIAEAFGMDSIYVNSAGTEESCLETELRRYNNTVRVIDRISDLAKEGVYAGLAE